MFVLTSRDSTECHWAGAGIHPLTMETPGFRRKLKPKTILVCEDDAMVAETLRMALSVDGHKVDTAGDGEQALGMFADAKYQLVITDFTIAKMDGLELA